MSITMFDQSDNEPGGNKMGKIRSLFHRKAKTVEPVALSARSLYLLDVEHMFAEARLVLEAGARQARR